jgi:hypothetical protein
VNKERKTITDVSTGPLIMTSLATPQLADGLETASVHVDVLYIQNFGSYTNSMPAF